MKNTQETKESDEIFFAKNDYLNAKTSEDKKVIRTLD
jgi:hypothetical protein